MSKPLGLSAFSSTAASGGGGSGGASAAGKMGLGAIILLGINGIIGSGAFLMPQQIYKDAGFVLGLATLLVSGIATLFIVFTYADLAGKVPGSGGGWLYCYTAWGRFTGFQVGIFVWFAGLATIATETAALIRVFRNMVPALKHGPTAWIVGTVVIAILAVINMFGPALTKLVDNVSSGAKIATAVFVIIAGAFAMKIANFKPLYPSSVDNFSSGSDAVMSAYGVTFYLFAGFSFLTIAGSRMKNQQKNLPKALLIVIAAVTAIYILIQTVTVGILGSKIADSSIPVAEAMRHSMGEWAYYIVIAGTAVSIFGVAFACSFEVPVLAASLANGHKLLPPWMGKKNKYGSPVVAIVITAVLASALLSTGDYVFLATLVVCASAIQYVPTILAVIKLQKVPSAKGAFQLKGAVRWIMVVLALAATSYLFLSFTWKVVLISLAIFGVGVLIYISDGKRRKDPTQAVDPLADHPDPVATRAGNATIDRSQMPAEYQTAAHAGTVGTTK